MSLSARKITVAATALALPIGLMITTAPTAQAAPIGSVLMTYQTSGISPLMNLPAAVDRVTITAIGGAGGGMGGGVGGSGAVVTATIDISNRNVLNFRVGGGGGHERFDVPGSFATAAGGSATSVWIDNERFMVAGGGGAATQGVGGSGAAGNAPAGGAGAGAFSGGGGSGAAGGAGAGPNGPAAGGTSGSITGAAGAAPNGGGGGGYWDDGPGGVGTNPSEIPTDPGSSGSSLRPAFGGAGGNGAGFAGGGGKGGGGGYGGGGGSTNAAGAGGSWVSPAYLIGAARYRPAPFTLAGTTYGKAGTAAVPGGDGAVLIQWGDLPGKSAKVAVKGKLSAKKRKVTWKKPSGTVSNYQLTVSQVGKKSYKGRNLLTRSLAGKKLTLKKKQLLKRAKKVNGFKGSRAKLIVRVNAANVLGSGATAKNKFVVRK